MKKVEADTLEEAYRKAAVELSCSVTDMQYEVIQHPSNGVLGFLKKKAIIVATCKNIIKKDEIIEVTTKEEVSNSTTSKLVDIAVEESIASEILDVIKDDDVLESKSEDFAKNDTVVDNFFAIDNSTKEDELDKEDEYEEEAIIYDELALLIENELKELLSHSCFDIDIVEVDVRDNTALIFLDGNDAALLIGKEGYRYNALSYMIFNWLHAKYELFIKLEIAEFLTSQQEMIKSYIKPVIEKVEKTGRGKTRTLNGILVQIALEQLREEFPDKYVAVKTGKEGNKFIVINEFNNKTNV